LPAASMVRCCRRFIEQNKDADIITKHLLLIADDEASLNGFR
jgi:hypothetical protein